jgi:four helix bundle protein
MNREALAQRTKKFALGALALRNQLPRQDSAWILGNQFLRAATSVGANYRAASRARSSAEFISKIGIVEEEADECCYWLELIQEGGIFLPGKIDPFLQEARELTAIFTASGRTAKRNRIGARLTVKG